MARPGTAAALVAAMLLSALGAIGMLVGARAGDRTAFGDAVATAIRDEQLSHALSSYVYGQVNEAYVAAGKTTPSAVYIPIVTTTRTAVTSPAALEALRRQGKAIHDRFAAGPTPQKVTLSLRFIEAPIAQVVALTDPAGVDLRVPGRFVLPPIAAGHGVALKAGVAGFRLFDQRTWFAPGLLVLAALLVALVIVRGRDRRLAVRWAGRAVTLAAVAVFAATYGLQYVLVRALAASSLEAQIDTLLLREFVADWWIAVVALLAAGLGLAWFGREPEPAAVSIPAEG